MLLSVGTQGVRADVFTDLTDVPSSYTDAAGLCAKVADSENGLEFGSCSGPEAVADDAAVVLVREDCTDLANCFESMSDLSDLSTGWLWNTRDPAPSSSAPVLVDIGPGTFGPFECDGGDYVSLRGAGREVSILSGTTTIADCEHLEFLDLGFHGSPNAVKWEDTGSSTWSNVELVSTDSGVSYFRGAWYDFCNGLPPSRPVGGVHYFHGSRVRMNGLEGYYTAAYYSTCGETWFYGGDIELVTDAGVTVGVVDAAAVLLGGDADFRSFGTSIRASAGGYSGYELYGVRIQDFSAYGLSAVFHGHGDVINVNADADPGQSTGMDATALSVADGFAHTPGSAFVVHARDGGTASRLEAGSSAVVHSPFLWQAGATPPTSSDESNVVSSLHGQDVFVETDCDDTGDCDDAGTDTHMMVYNSSCSTNGPWFDLVMGACRQ